jgi:hypothetical protein
MVSMTKTANMNMGEKPEQHIPTESTKRRPEQELPEIQPQLKPKRRKTGKDKQPELRWQALLEEQPEPNTQKEFLKGSTTKKQTNKEDPNSENSG